MAEATLAQVHDVQPLIGQGATVNPDKFDAARMENAKATAGSSDNLNLHTVQFTDANKGAAPDAPAGAANATQFKMQDLDDPKNKDKAPLQLLEENGMPKDNAGGKRDAFLDKVMDNTLADKLKEDGYLSKDAANPSEEEFGKKLVDMVYDRQMQEAGGPEAYKTSLGLKTDASESAAREASKNSMFSNIERELGVPINDYGTAYKYVRESGREDLKRQLGIRD